jgi:hypothetical protein
MPAQYEIPAGWGLSPYQDLTLPSGSVIQVKMLSLEDLVRADLLDEFDKLSGVAEEKVVQPAKGKRPQDRQKKKPTKAEAEKAQAASIAAMMSADNIGLLTGLMGRLLPLVIIQPRVRSHLVKTEAGKWDVIDPADREEGQIYIDTVPFPDQMAILEFAMEGMDQDSLQQFREQREASVGDVDAKPTAQDPPL